MVSAMYRNSSIDTWPIWVSQTATQTTSVIWTAWMSNSTQSLTTTPWSHRVEMELDVWRGEMRRASQRVEIADEIANRARIQEECRAASRRQKEAHDRAEILLLSHLSKEQREDYRKHKHFCVKVAGGRIYRIRAGSLVGNVDIMDSKGKEVIQRYCAHPVGVPMPDALLTQMMHLRHHESEFLRIANRH